MPAAMLSDPHPIAFVFFQQAGQPDDHNQMYSSQQSVFRCQDGQLAVPGQREVLRQCTVRKQCAVQGSLFVLFF